MKKELAGGALTLVLLNFVSAYYTYGISFSGFINSLNPRSVFFLLSFLIFFLLLQFFAFSRVFRNNRTIGGMISAIVAFGASYGLYIANFDILSFFSVSIDILIMATFAIFIIFLILFWVRFKTRGVAIALFVIGLLLLLAGALTNIFYEKGTVVMIGGTLMVVVLLFVGLKKFWGKKLAFLFSLLGIIAIIAGFLFGGMWIGIIITVLVIFLIFMKILRKRNPYMPGPLSDPSWYHSNKKQWKAMKTAGSWTGKQAWKGTKGVGKGAGWAGKKSWSGAQVAGSAGKQAIQQTKEQMKVAARASKKFTKQQWKLEQQAMQQRAANLKKAGVAAGNFAKSDWAQTKSDAKAAARASKEFAQQQWQAEQQAMQQRTERIRQIQEKTRQRKIDKLMKKANRLNQEGIKIASIIEKLDPVQNQVLIQKYTRDYNSIRKELERIGDKVNKL